MREVAILKYCEWCWLDSETRTPATQTWSVGLAAGEVSNPEVKLIDCCDTHNTVMLILQAGHASTGDTPTARKPSAAVASPLQREPRRRGRPPMAALTPAGDQRNLIPCPVCGEGRTKGSLISHIWGVHVGRPRPTAPTTCPDCGVSYPQATSCGVHRRQSHGYDPVADAVANVPDYSPRAIGKGA